MEGGLLACSHAASPLSPAMMISRPRQLQGTLDLLVPPSCRKTKRATPPFLYLMPPSPRVSTHLPRFFSFLPPSLPPSQAMQATTPGLTEHQLESIMEHSVKMQGAQRLSFPPVVAGGSRANCLHYIANNKTLK